MKAEIVKVPKLAFSVAGLLDIGFNRNDVYLHVFSLKLLLPRPYQMSFML